MLSVRTEALAFYKQSLIYMGEAAKFFVSKLKKVQVEELERFYEESLKEVPKPTRSIEDYSNQLSGKLGAKGTSLDVYEISDPIEIFNKFNDTWCEKVLAQAKWSDKKSLLDELLNAANVPKLANSQFYPVTTMLKKLLNDSNVIVMVHAIKIYGALAKGLRKYFGQTCKIVLGLILSKFKVLLINKNNSL